MNIEDMTDEQIESEALKQGFNPNFEGENKKTHKEFLEVAYNHNHVLKERNEKLSHDYDELKAELQQTKSSIDKLVSFQEEQKQKAIEKAVRELKAERREAISDGDADKVEEIEKEIDKQQDKVAESQGNPIFDTWISNNKWYTTDEDLAVEMDLITQDLVKTGRFGPIVNGVPQIDPNKAEKLLQAAEKRVAKAFPEKFKNPKKDEPPEVDGGRPSPQRNSKKSYADLPADAKSACDEFISEGIFKTREQYVAAYEFDE